MFNSLSEASAAEWLIKPLVLYLYCARVRFPVGFPQYQEHFQLIPEPTARSAVMGVSPERGLLISY